MKRKRIASSPDRPRALLLPRSVPIVMTQKRTQMNLEAFTNLAQCRSLPELIAAQAALIRDNAELTLENSRRLSELSVGVIEDTTRTASKPKAEPAGRAA